MQMVQTLQVVKPGEKRTRQTRVPNFNLSGRIQVQGLYPYFATPVLPGESLDRHAVKATVVSPPIDNPLSGAWLEHWLYYVKLTDIDPRLSEMFIGALTATTGYTAATDKPRYFTKAGQIDWINMAVNRIHECYFRDEDEAAVSHPDGVLMIKNIGDDVFSSAVHAQTLTGADAGNVAGPTPDDQMAAFLKMRQMGMGFASYEEYLRSYGLSPAETPQSAGEPELLSYRRHWSLPSNVLDPATGSPTGAWYWRLDDTADKPKRFVEPGFLIGLWSVRPKWFDANFAANYTPSLWGFSDWLPPYSLNDPAAGIRSVDAADQAFITTAEADPTDIWFDHRDLLSHGEQFVNGNGRFTRHAHTGRVWTDTASEAQLRGQYVNTGAITSVFAGTSDGLIDYDGLCTVAIKGHVRDET